MARYELAVRIFLPSTSSFQRDDSFSSLFIHRRCRHRRPRNARPAAPIVVVAHLNISVPTSTAHPQGSLTARAAGLRAIAIRCANPSIRLSCSTAASISRTILRARRTADSWRGVQLRPPAPCYCSTRRGPRTAACWRAVSPKGSYILPNGRTATVRTNVRAGIAIPGATVVRLERLRGPAPAERLLVRPRPSACMPIDSSRRPSSPGVALPNGRVVVALMRNLQRRALAVTLPNGCADVVRHVSFARDFAAHPVLQPRRRPAAFSIRGLDVESSSRRRERPNGRSTGHVPPLNDRAGLVRQVVFVKNVPRRRPESSPIDRCTNRHGTSSSAADGQLYVKSSLRRCCVVN
ncbi:hypothetical protein AURDEDRAFT_163892 [Auricularia subglabra TFB-10046 SS5]|nr:hypothetical protein AURDEDRAFT_163892 [Auricularia subglabra TFB-10046 SS5]